MIVPRFTVDKSKLKPFRVYSDWCYIDCLGDEQICDKDTAVIVWPNGKTEIVTFSANVTSKEISDMGTPFTLISRLAYCSLSINSAIVRVRPCTIEGLKGYFLNTNNRTKYEFPESKIPKVFKKGK